jgi:hypothetical protein
MPLGGGTLADVEAALHVAVMEHPEISVLDRMNVLTRQMASEALLARTAGWLSEGDAASS